MNVNTAPGQVSSASLTSVRTSVVSGWLACADAAPLVAAASPALVADAKRDALDVR